MSIQGIVFSRVGLTLSIISHLVVDMGKNYYITVDILACNINFVLIANFQ